MNPSENKNELDILLESIELAARNKDQETYTDLIYNALREHFVHIAHVNSIAPQILHRMSSLPDDVDLVETYLNAFSYFYSYSIRQRNYFFGYPASFGYKYTGKQNYFNHFLNLIKNKMIYCSPAQQVQHCVNVMPTRMAFTFIKNTIKTTDDIVTLKNAATSLMYLKIKNKIFDPESTLALPQHPEIDSYNLILKFLINEVDEFDLMTGIFLDEDTDLFWMQSFLSTIRTSILLEKKPSREIINFAFEEIDRLRYLPEKRGFQYEMDAYMCLNENMAAILFKNRNLIKKSVDGDLFGYYIEIARERNLQSHELLRKGIILDKNYDQTVKIYDYQVTL